MQNLAKFQAYFPSKYRCMVWLNNNLQRLSSWTKLEVISGVLSEMKEGKYSTITKLCHDALLLPRDCSEWSRLRVFHYNWKSNKEHVGDL